MYQRFNRPRTLTEKDIKSLTLSAGPVAVEANQLRQKIILKQRAEEIQRGRDEIHRQAMLYHRAKISNLSFWILVTLCIIFVLALGLLIQGVLNTILTQESINTDVTEM